MRCNILDLVSAILAFYAPLRLVEANIGMDVSKSVDTAKSAKHHTLKLLPEIYADVDNLVPTLNDPNATLNEPNATLNEPNATFNEPNDDEKLRPLTWTLRELLIRNRSSMPSVTKRTSADIARTVELTPSLHKRIYKRTPVMDNFHDAYVTFHRSLVVFVRLLSESFKPGTSTILLNVRQLPEVMTPNDLDIATRNVDRIIEKFFIVQEVLLTVFQKIKPYVRNEYSEWLRNQSMVLKWKMNMAGFVTFSLRLGNTGPKILILSPGIGSTNNGVNYGMNYQTLLKLNDLMKQLHYEKP